MNIRTVSNYLFPLFEPKSEDVRLGDIITGLAHTCRFNGQLRSHYSVLAHSILVADILWEIGNSNSKIEIVFGLSKTFLTKTNQNFDIGLIDDKDIRDCSKFSTILWGLVHDASEAYIGDVSSPLKALMRRISADRCVESPYDIVEKGIMAAIIEKFSLPTTPPPVIKKADMIAREIEAAHFYATADRHPYANVPESMKGFGWFGNSPEEIETMKATYKKMVEKFWGRSE